MSTLAFIADVHLGNPNRFGGPVTAGINERGRLVLNVFRATCARAREQGVDRLVIAGDLADTSRWRPQWVRAAQNALAVGPERVDVLMGNHDQESTAPGDHALGPLTEVNLVAVHEQPAVVDGPDYQLWVVPFQPGVAAEWFPAALAELGRGESAAGRRRILSFHLGVKDARTVAWLADSPDAIDVDVLASLMVEHGITHAFAGNWHDRQMWSREGRCIVQCGALSPTGWANPGLEGYGRITYLDVHTGAVTPEELPGPRFLKAAWGDDFEAKVRAATARQHAVFLELTAPPDQLADARGWLEYALAMGWLRAGEAVPDDSAAREAAQQAGRVARSADTLDEAIGGFVSTMPLDPDVPRAAVLEEIRRYTPGRSS